MLSEERERLARLEATYEILEKSVRSIEEKVDKLIASANIGRGAFWMLMKVGGFVIALSGLASWFLNHFGGRS